MTKMIQDGFFILKQIRFFPIAYITQNKNYSKCPREMLKSLSMLDLDLEKRKLYFAITHDFVNNRIKRNSRLRTFAKVKFFVRDITIHNQRLFSACNKCADQCRYSQLKNKQLKNVDGYFILFYKKF